MTELYIALFLSVSCGFLGYEAGKVNETIRLEAKCLSTQKTPYADAVAFCKEQVK